MSTMWREMGTGGMILRSTSTTLRHYMSCVAGLPALQSICFPPVRLFLDGTTQQRFVDSIASREISESSPSFPRPSEDRVGVASGSGRAANIAELLE